MSRNPDEFLTRFQCGVREWSSIVVRSKMDEFYFFLQLEEEAGAPLGILIHDLHELG